MGMDSDLWYGLLWDRIWNYGLWNVYGERDDGSPVGKTPDSYPTVTHIYSPHIYSHTYISSVKTKLNSTGKTKFPTSARFEVRNLKNYNNYI